MRCFKPQSLYLLRSNRKLIHSPLPRVSHLAQLESSRGGKLQRNPCPECGKVGRHRWSPPCATADSGGAAATVPRAGEAGLRGRLEGQAVCEAREPEAAHSSGVPAPEEPESWGTCPSSSSAVQPLLPLVRLCRLPCETISGSLDYNQHVHRCSFFSTLQGWVEHLGWYIFASRCTDRPVIFLPLLYSDLAWRTCSNIVSLFLFPGRICSIFGGGFVICYFKTNEPKY